MNEIQWDFQAFVSLTLLCIGLVLGFLFVIAVRNPKQPTNHKQGDSNHGTNQKDPREN